MNSGPLDKFGLMKTEKLKPVIVHAHLIRRESNG